MVFVNTKVFVERVARALERAGYRVGVLSGDVPQKKRETLLKRFQAGQLEILVATDVAARGLHIDGVEFVFNYDLPFDPEDYVHRIGRTARRGKEGDAISFACERYAVGLPDIEAFIEQKIPSEPVTAELLKPLPRKPREGGETDAAEGESVGEIFREAREQRAAEDARRGGGRSGGGRREGGRGRRDGAGGERRGRGPRSDRAEGAGQPGQGQDEAQVDAAGQGAEQAPASAAGGAPDGDAPRPPRRRRRRRGGAQRQAQGEGRQDQGQDGNGQGDARAGTGAQDSQPAGPQDDADRPSRKRRRRRGGRRVNGAEGAPQAEGNRQEGDGRQARVERDNPSQARRPRNDSGGAASGTARAEPKPKAPRHVPAKAATAAPTPADSGGLISRIGRGLRKLVSRDPA